MEDKNCIFCKTDAVIDCGTVKAVFDSFPVSDGHMLIMPKEHRMTFFDMTNEEKHDSLECINRCKKLLDEMYNPDGYNVGFNVGTASGQTIMHAHIHVIPRFIGDVENPRGGVRGVIPSKQNY